MSERWPSGCDPPCPCPPMATTEKRPAGAAVYTGDYNMSRKSQHWYEHPRSKTPPSKEQAALKYVQDLAGPSFGEQKRKSVKRRATKLVFPASPSSSPPLISPPTSMRTVPHTHSPLLSPTCGCPQPKIVATPRLAHKLALLEEAEG